MSKEQVISVLTHAMLWQSLLWFGFLLTGFSLFEEVLGLKVVPEYRVYGLAIGVSSIVCGSLLKIWRSMKGVD